MRTSKPLGQVRHLPNYQGIWNCTNLLENRIALEINDKVVKKALQGHIAPKIQLCNYIKNQNSYIHLGKYTWHKKIFKFKIFKLKVKKLLPVHSLLMLTMSNSNESYVTGGSPSNPSLSLHKCPRKIFLLFTIKHNACMFWGVFKSATHLVCSCLCELPTNFL